MTKDPKVSFIIAGAQKSGTTALGHFLRSHPALFLPETEVHFFDNDTINWNQPSYAVLEKRFDAAHPEQRAGYRTPIYMFWDNSMERIQAYNPKMKLVVILRNPTRRAYSNWKMESLKELEVLPFATAIREGRERTSAKDDPRFLNKRRFSYVERGFYAQQIERMLKFFPRGQVLFLTNDQMRADRDATLDAACSFLDVPPFESYPENREILPRTAVTLTSEKDVPPPNEADLQYLNELFASDIKKTADLTGLDLNEWQER